MKKVICSAMIIAYVVYTYEILPFSISRKAQKQISQIIVTGHDAEKIGQKIWENECQGSKEQLTWWKEGENFASLGIGHFIWFPHNCAAPFTETFPSLLIFMKGKGAKLPQWLAKNPQQPCPWNSREDFFLQFHTQRMQQLRKFLTKTIDLQVQFIMFRLQDTLPSLLDTVSHEKKGHIQEQFNRIAQSPLGLYALIDYIHFKGEGTNPNEQYNGKGWGLLQVLERMNGNEIGYTALQEFAHAATTVLTQRVAHAPHEAGYLPGWQKRIETYVK